jgi:hypothetical protein
MSLCQYRERFSGCGSGFGCRGWFGWLLLIDLNVGLERRLMDPFIAELNDEHWKREQKRKDAFWSGHSLYQIPMRVLGYRGKAESLILAYLYERANSISFRSNEVVLIEVKIREETIARKTRLSLWAVSKGINALQADNAIRVCRKRDAITNQIKTSVYIPLHSETAEPLMCSPQTYGVCSENSDRPYITVPKDATEKMVQMNASARQVYLAALALASVRLETNFGISRDDWKAKSLVGRNAFDRGIKDCIKNGLLTYRRYEINLNAVGGSRKERIQHDNPRWKFDLNVVSAAEWERVCTALLRREFTVASDGWTYTTREALCPFCKEPRGFRVNFGEAKYKCFACERFGRMGQLVQRVLRVTSMSEAKKYIKAVIAKQELKAA